MPSDRDSGFARWIDLVLPARADWQ
jgi:hypothetical protein